MFSLKIPQGFFITSSLFVDTCKPVINDSTEKYRRAANENGYQAVFNTRGTVTNKQQREKMFTNYSSTFDWIYLITAASEFL